MIIKNKLLLKTFYAAIFMVGLSILMPAPAANALDGSFEWIDSGTIKVTYEAKEGLNSTKDFTFNLTGTPPKYTGSTEHSAFTYSTVNGLEKCSYTVEAEVSDNKETASINSFRTSNDFLTSCPDQLFPGSVNLGGLQNADAEAGSNADEGENVSSCKIDGVGWLLCPIMYFFGNITDQAKKLVTILLETQPLGTLTNDQNPTYMAWNMMRGFANIAFVIAFIFIIFSQLTSFGIGNYGVKKLLPRLVIAGILVNVSYWICAIAIDLTNIIGSSLTVTLESITNKYTPEGTSGFWSGGGESFMTLIGAVIGATAVGSALVFVNLTILLPILITALAAIVTVVVVLTIRQALLIVLVVISPIAFVAFLLPNTESWFGKWRGLFTTLLLMYPAVALIFGVSAFASKVIMHSSEEIPVQIIGAGVAIIPLFITPLVMKTAGGVLNRIGGIVNNADKGAFDRMRKGAGDLRERKVAQMQNRALQMNPNGLRARAINRRNRLNAIGENNKRELSRNATEHVANLATEDSDQGRAFLEELGGPSQRARQSAKAGAIATQDKLFNEQVNEGVLILRGKDQDDLRSLSMGQSTASGDITAESDLALQTAAQRRVIETQDQQGIEALIDASQNMTEDQRSNFGHEIAKNRPTWLGASRADMLQNGEAIESVNELKLAALESNAYSPEAFVKADKGELEEMHKFIANNRQLIDTVDPTLVQRFSANADIALENPRFSGALGKREDIVRDIRSLSPPTNQPAAATGQTQGGTGGTGPTNPGQQPNNGPANGGGPGTGGNSGGANPQGGGNGGGNGGNNGGGNPGPAFNPQPQQPTPSPQQQATANANMRTNPNIPGTSNWPQSPSGLHIPHGNGPSAATTAAAAAAGAAAGTAAASRGQAAQPTTQPIVNIQAPQQQYPQTQQQQTLKVANIAPAPATSAMPSAAVTAAAAAAGAAVGGAATGNRQATSPATIPGGGGATTYTTVTNNNSTTNHASNTTNATNNVQQRYETEINQADADFSNMPTEELARRIGEEHGNSGSEETLKNLTREFGRRRGFDGPSQPYDPQNPPKGPLS